MFCFTVIQTYFLVVVYSLYRELNGTAPTTVATTVPTDMSEEID